MHPPPHHHKIVGQLSFKKRLKLDLNTPQTTKIRVNDPTHLQHPAHSRGAPSGALFQQILPFSGQSLPKTRHTPPSEQHCNNSCFLLQCSIDTQGLFCSFSHIFEHASNQKKAKLINWFCHLQHENFYRSLIKQPADQKVGAE